MTAQLLAAFIMFVITTGFAALFWFPAVRFTQRNSLLRFYWTGFWGFLGCLAALSGAQAVLTILGLNVDRFAGAMLAGISASFVAFVMFAWGRLALSGAGTLLKKAAK